MSVVMFGFKSFNPYEGAHYDASWHEQSTLAYTAIFLTTMLTLQFELFQGYGQRNACCRVSSAFLLMGVCLFMIILSNFDTIDGPTFEALVSPQGLAAFFGAVSIAFLIPNFVMSVTKNYF